MLQIRTIENGDSEDPKAAYKTINARAETVDTAPSFRQAFKKRRCLVPVDGFYEWKKVPGGKIACSISRKDVSVRVRPAQRRRVVGRILSPFHWGYRNHQFLENGGTLECSNGLPVLPTVERPNFTTGVGRGFYSKTWGGFGTDLKTVQESAASRRNHASPSRPSLYKLQPQGPRVV